MQQRRANARAAPGAESIAVWLMQPGLLRTDGEPALRLALATLRWRDGVDEIQATCALLSRAVQKSLLTPYWRAKAIEWLVDRSDAPHAPQVLEALLAPMSPQDRVTLLVAEVPGTPRLSFAAHLLVCGGALAWATEAFARYGASLDSLPADWYSVVALDAAFVAQEAGWQRACAALGALRPRPVDPVVACGRLLRPGPGMGGPQGALRAARRLVNGNIVDVDALAEHLQAEGDDCSSSPWLRERAGELSAVVRACHARRCAELAVEQASSAVGRAIESPA